MRFDLPTADESDEIDRIAATLIGMVCRLPDADAVAAVVYTDECFGTDGMPHAELIDALEDRAHACGIRVTDALCVAADAWGSHFDPALPERGGRSTSSATNPVGRSTCLSPRATRRRARSCRASISRNRSGRPVLSRPLEDAVRLLCGPDATARRRLAERARGPRRGGSGIR